MRSDFRNPHVVIVHGTMGSPEGNWFPWISEKLRADNIDVSVPTFPTPGDQNLESWLATFSDAIGNPDSNFVLVGHSIGAAFVLRVLERIDTPVKAVFLVAGFTHELGNPEFDQLNASFVNRNFDWEKIRGNAEIFRIYNGDDDPYVPLAQGQELAERLGVMCHVIRNGGHLNASSGYTRFDKLLKDIKDVLLVDNAE